MDEKLELFCYVFMPFDSSLSFVYDFGIKPLVKEFNNEESDYKLTIQRADEDIITSGHNINKIKDAIWKCDIAIIDISNRNPSVMWELGYCEALNKETIIIRQDSDSLPYNINQKYIIRYELSTYGLEVLAKKLAQILGTISENKIQTIRFDSEIDDLFKVLDFEFRKIHENSILKNFAKNELKRIANRIEKLNHEGVFDLRNWKDMNEVITYYSDYIKELDNSDCSYKTLSFFEFWEDFEKRSPEADYLHANIVAANEGTLIQRCFVIDSKKFATNSVNEDPNKKRVLQKHYYASLNHDNIATKVFFTENELELDLVNNFALWRKGSEKILFLPYYGPTGQMIRTNFHYYDPTLRANRKFRESQRYISLKEKKFDEIWGKGVPLDQHHFQ